MKYNDTCISRSGDIYWRMCFQERRQQTQEEMGAMEDEMRKAQDLIKQRKEEAIKQQLGSKRLAYTNLRGRCYSAVLAHRSVCLHVCRHVCASDSSWLTWRRVRKIAFTVKTKNIPVIFWIIQYTTIQFSTIEKTGIYLILIRFLLLTLFLTWNVMYIVTAVNSENCFVILVRHSFVWASHHVLFQCIYG